MFMCYGWWSLRLSRPVLFLWTLKLTWLVLVSSPLKKLQHNSTKFVHYFPNKSSTLFLQKTHAFQTLISFCFPTSSKRFFILRASSTTPLKTIVPFHILPLEICGKVSQWLIGGFSVADGGLLSYELCWGNSWNSQPSTSHWLTQVWYFFKYSPAWIPWKGSVNFNYKPLVDLLWDSLILAALMKWTVIV